MVSAAVQAKAKREQGQGALALSSPPLPPCCQLFEAPPAAYGLRLGNAAQAGQ